MSKKELSNLRNQINKLDEKLFSIIFKRMDIAKKIGDIKGYEKTPYEKDLGTTTKVIREGKLIPILTKALQECMVKIETLETSNADLISRVKTLEDA